MRPSDRCQIPRLSISQVPLEKGYSQMEWMQLSRKHPDLAGQLLTCRALHHKLHVTESQTACVMRLRCMRHLLRRSCCSLGCRLERAAATARHHHGGSEAA